MTNGKTTKIWHNFRKNLQKLEKSKENYVQNNYDKCKKEYENKLFPNQSVLTLLVKTSQPNWHWFTVRKAAKVCAKYFTSRRAKLLVENSDSWMIPQIFGKSTWIAFHSSHMNYWLHASQHILVEKSLGLNISHFV